MSEDRLAIFKQEFPIENFGGSWLIPGGTDQGIMGLVKQICGVTASTSHPWNCLDVGDTQANIQRPYDLKGNECYRSIGWNTPAGHAFQKAWKDAGLTCKYIDTSYEAKTVGGTGSITINTAVILLGNAEK
jgi:hypothetical protein